VIQICKSRCFGRGKWRISVLCTFPLSTGSRCRRHKTLPFSYLQYRAFAGGPRSGGTERKIVGFQPLAKARSTLHETGYRRQTILLNANRILPTAKLRFPPEYVPSVITCKPRRPRTDGFGKLPPERVEVPLGDPHGLEPVAIGKLCASINSRTYFFQTGIVDSKSKQTKFHRHGRSRAGRLAAGSRALVRWNLGLGLIRYELQLPRQIFAPASYLGSISIGRQVGLQGTSDGTPW